MAHENLQGNKPGDDPNKYGLKFDSGKARWDLLQMKELKEIVAIFSETNPVCLLSFDEDKIYTEIMSDITDYFVSGDKRDLLYAGFNMFFLLRGKPYTEEEIKKCNEMVERWDLIDINEVQKIADVYAYGAKLYQDNNWMRVDQSRYKAALLRHFKTVRSKERYDGESGFLHLHHALWNVITLLWFKNQEEK